MNIDNFNDNSAFIEEKENLKKNIEKIKKVEELSQLEWNKNKEEIDNCISGNGEDLRYKQDLLFKNQTIMKTILQYRNYTNSPYFGRMVLESNKEIINMYIGESSIADINHEQIVYDWRSPVASLFYSNQTNYKYKNYLYNLELKRKTVIELGRLTHCYEIYSKNKKDSKIIDEFLKSVLANKKDSDDFVDIIKTIQDKQNTIIRENKDNNIIVQGVAGSGKTVIILHRLSYLLFNNPEINPNSFLFIAPTDIFMNKLNNLNKKLQIDKIGIFTIYDYYKNKIHSLFNERIVVNDEYKKNIQIDKIINDEYGDTEYILSRYSTKYYKCVFDKIYNTINNQIIEIVDNLISVKNIEKDNMISRIKIIKNKIDEVKNKELSNKENIEREINTFAKKLLEEFTQICSYNTSENTNIINLTNITVYEAQSIIESKLNKVIIEESNDNIEIKNKFEKLNQTEKTINKNIHEINFMVNKIKYLKNINMDFENHVEFFSNINKYKSKFENSLKKKRKEIDNNTSLINKKQTFFSKLFNPINIDKLQKENELLSYESEKIISNLNIIKDIINYYNSEFLPNIKTYNEIMEDSSEDFNSLNNIHEFKTVFYDYNSFIEKIYRYMGYIKIDNQTKIIFKRIYALLYSCIGNNILIEQFKNLNLFEFINEMEENIDFDLLDNCNSILSSLNEIISPMYLWHSYENYLKIEDEVAYSNYYNPRRKKLNRVDAYILLKLSVDLGYNKLKNYQYIYIDEAQDYNDNEILLIYCLEGSPILNIYGDINQSIFKNVVKRKNWDTLKETLKLDFNNYELNENYRNTVEVVNYCNKHLNLKMLPVGNNGQKVIYEKFENLKTIIEKNQSAGGIVITNNEAYLKELKENDVKCCSISLSKGLEFTNVIAIIDDNISSEEQYVLFTRTLNNLVIYKDRSDETHGK